VIQNDMLTLDEKVVNQGVGKDEAIAVARVKTGIIY
jgi:hypothetical protein